MHCIDVTYREFGSRQKILDCMLRENYERR
jgi:hypothetical protein